MNPELKMPFKRYEIGKVFRDGPVKIGRMREFWQCDVDTVGTGSVLADAEILAVVDRVFKRLEFPVVIKLSNRKFLEGILDFSGVSRDKRFDAIIAIDKLEKLGESEVVREMEQKGIPDDVVAKIMSMINMKGSNKELIEQLKGLIKSDTGLEGLQEIEEIIGYCDCFGIRCVEFTPSLARGLAYYTGPVFEVFLKNSDIKSAAAGGGRYDEMIGGYLGGAKSYPATGISFGLEVITEALRQKKEFDRKSVTRAFVIPIKTASESIRIAEELREAGIETGIDLMSRGISKNLGYANSMNIPFAVFVGEKELKQGKVKLRDMKSGKEELLSVKDMVKKLKN
jgi:histidyl-tRNA synthetase